MKHMTDMAEHYVVNANDNFGTTREGHPKFANFLPSEFGATKDYWEDKGIPSGCLLNVYLPRYWKSDSSPPDDEWSSS